MGSNYTVDPLAGRLTPTDINDNLESIETALDRSLSRFGDGNNSMQDTLDMNGQMVLNLPDPTHDTEPATYKQMREVLQGVANAVSSMVFAGIWNPMSGSFPSGASLGDVFIASQSGSVDGVNFLANDKLIALVDSASTDTYASNWYKSNQITSGAIVFAGTWAPSSGSFPSNSIAGDLYLASGSGTVDGVSFSANDRLVALKDNASTTTYSNNWYKMLYGSGVSSVFGRTGSVVALSGDYTADLIDETATNKIMTAAERTKLSNIAANAEVNVQSDWNETNPGSDGYIENKPTIPTDNSSLANGAGYIAIEADPTVPSHVKSITQQQVTSWNTGLSNMNKQYTAASAPTSNEDSTKGYSVGSLGIDTSTNTVYVCTDATNSSAVWTQVS